MLSLKDIIVSIDLEAKRALAVQMYIEHYGVKDICDLLNVSDSFVSKWKIIYENEGADGLRLKYEGGLGYLTDLERGDVIFYFSDKPHCSVEEVRDHIDSNYGVVYKSKQSYNEGEGYLLFLGGIGKLIIKYGSGFILLTLSVSMSLICEMWIP